MQSLMIDDYGVTKLSSSEMQDIDGGILILSFILIELVFPFIEAFLKGASSF